MLPQMCVGVFIKEGSQGAVKFLCNFTTTVIVSVGVLLLQSRCVNDMDGKYCL
jgi:hypothetical protein